MELLNILVGGLGGAIISAVVALYIFHNSKPKQTGLAYELLGKLQFLLKTTAAEYYFTKSVDENYHVARLIYQEADADVIATAFNENPENYGESDLARGYRYGSHFTRITCHDVCPEPSAKVCKKTLTKILRGSKLIVIPRGEAITKIDGVFCRFRDSTYLCAISFRNPESLEKNKGVVFRDGIAEGFFEYYKFIADKYGEYVLAKQSNSLDGE